MDDAYRQERYKLLEGIDEVAKKLAAHDSGHALLNLATRLTEYDNFYRGEADEETLQLLAEYRGEDESEHDALVNFMAAIEDAIEEAEEDKDAGNPEQPETRVSVPA